MVEAGFAMELPETTAAAPQLTRRQLEQILDSVGDALTVADGAWRVVHMSPLAMKLVGRDRTDLIGGDFWQLFPKLVGTPVEAKLRAVMANREPVRFEAIGPISGRWHDTAVHPCGDGIAIFARDIDDRKRAEVERLRSQDQFTRFMEQLPGLAWIKDLDGRYVFANGAALRIFGAAREQVIGRTDTELFPSDTAAQFVANDHAALASPAGLQTVEMLKHDDGTVHYSIVSKFAIPGPDDKPALVGGMAIDITERIRAEAAVREHAERLSEADRRKDEFLAILGHELRNPLAPIRTALEVLRRRGDRGPEARELHEMMERQVRTLTRLTDEMLDISRVTRGKVELHRELVDVAAVVGRAVETARPLIEQRGHRLTVTLPAGPLRVHADPVRMEQVLANLLNNAAKYTPPGGQIWLEAEKSVGSEQWAAGVAVGSEKWAVGSEEQSSSLPTAHCPLPTATIRVRDTGIGIRPEVLPRLFEPFQQADRVPGRVQEGLGIGLALVKGLVELHGGTVSVRSDGAGQGSEFTVRLPLAPAATLAADREDEGGGAAPSPPRRVLVVDDNVDAAESLAILLRMKGHEVHCAHDGPSALEAAAAVHPELILLDIGMPGMDGYEVAQRLRAGGGLGGALLVAVTGYGQEDDRARSHAAGFDEHFVKPLTSQTLREILARVPGPHS
jgi:PAS domain S-box-containing protein